jgi:short-subunit dehydrogenase
LPGRARPTMIRRTMKEPVSVLITGASGGIGAALAKAYARPGVTLALTGRNEERLRAAVATAAAAGAIVLYRALDVRDGAALTSWIGEVEAAHPLDLVIANAGITGGHHDGADESIEEVRRLIETNFLAACRTVDAALPAMRRRRHGQIAFVSSLAGVRGLSHMPGYSASKAALIAYAEAMRGWLRDDGIEVAIVLPGNVDTPMLARESGPKPMTLTAERTAAIIKRGLARRRACIAFPFPLYWLLRTSTLLPAAPVDKVLNRFRVTVTAYD